MDKAKGDEWEAGMGGAGAGHGSVKMETTLLEQHKKNRKKSVNEVCCNIVFIQWLSVVSCQYKRIKRDNKASCPEVISRSDLLIKMTGKYYTNIIISACGTMW